jgi:D-alanyl-lipoteichoic acid acyltransferase DltB (MBOAT superfamily)
VGISFYTFQTLSYTIEVYRYRQEPEKHFGYFALYVSYFPQLVAGPIERPKNLLPQLRSKHDFDYNRVTEGLGLIVWGLFKKVVIADRLALVVDNVYSQPDRFAGAGLTIATIFFAFQIYCDFSGYSDIAIGSAQVMGHRLMRNFDRPYFASSIAEFWKRWHISLSSWFRDYLYIPLGGSRVRIPRLCVNILIVFVISGLWHGANWTFIAWGFLHGLYYLIAKATNSYRERIAEIVGLKRHHRFHILLKGIATFILVCFAWILFRANSISDAFVIISRLGTGWADVWSTSGFTALLKSFNVPEEEFWLGLLFIGLLVFMQYLHGPKRVTELFARWNRLFRWLVYILLVLMIFNLGIAQKIPFIYFQF